MASNLKDVKIKTSQTWDRCIENSLVKTGYGTVIGGLGAVLLFRSPIARTGVTALFAGVGAGISIVESRLAFQAGAPTLSTFHMPSIDFGAKKQD